MKPFKIPKSSWKTISIDSINFVLSEAKDYLDYTIKESDKITSRAYSIVLLLFAILSGTIGYTFNKVSHSDFSKIILLNFCLSFVMIFLLFHLGRLVFPRKLMVKGRLPRKIALKEFLLTPELSKEENYLSFIIQEVENTQVKIDYNLTCNKKRQQRLKNIMIAIAILFPLYLIIAGFTAL